MPQDLILIILLCRVPSILPGILAVSHHLSFVFQPIGQEKLLRFSLNIGRCLPKRNYQGDSLGKIILTLYINKYFIQNIFKIWSLLTISMSPHLWYCDLYIRNIYQYLVLVPCSWHRAPKSLWISQVRKVIKMWFIC